MGSSDAGGGRRRLLTGWGRTAPSAATVVTAGAAGDGAGRAEAVVGLLGDPGPRGVVARGLGRSYGDAAQCAGGTVVDMTGMDRIQAFDPSTGSVTVDAGVSLETLMRVFLPRGWFVPVTPGTRFVTVGGAMASDIHGKNHHADGSFANHVTSLVLATPSGVRRLTPGSGPGDPSPDARLFWATAGGMGLTGVVLEATISLIPVETARIRIDTERLPDLDALMAAMAEGDEGYRYSMAWVDSLARGRHLGRAILMRGDHARLDDLPPPRDPERARTFVPNVLVEAPPFVPGGLLNRATVRAFNEMWFRKAPRHEVGALESLTSFFHPLDMVGGWNRIYGPRGFVQYQFVVPLGAEETLRLAMERLSRAGAASFLTVLKRFGPGNGLLSFPIPGWTLALDIPAGSGGLGRLLDELDEAVAGAGGRVYLAKDSRLRPELLAAMYPRLGEWRSIRDRADPEGLLCSDLGRRLGLAGSPDASPTHPPERIRP